MRLTVKIFAILCLAPASGWLLADGSIGSGISLLVAAGCLVYIAQRS